MIIIICNDLLGKIMKFIGRTQELAFLKDAYRSNKAEFILVSGRRRIGKTALLAEFAKDKPCLFFSCTQSGNREQLERFSRAVLSQGTPALSSDMRVDPSDDIRTDPPISRFMQVYCS